MKSVFYVISVCASVSHPISDSQATAIIGMFRQMKRDIFS
ncbi:hypothetical protein VIM7927_02646 [Vibrio mangrovi]|uniref:Uncharacterized protein n=1 Tax=Vibrio mangrovi TaxID=474394 RepID=A0A1Y6IX02_9VIBR|nr:hypothetical protein VIM7927_02646 [Vibrio mangrovi]